MFHPLNHPLERGWVGRVDDGRVIHLAAQTLQSFFTGGGSAREHAAYPLADVCLLAPVLHPPAVRVFDDEDTFVFANPAAIVGPRAEVGGGPLELLPRLVGVVGADEALAGYTLLADWRRPGLGPPKDRDFALGLGPLLATPEELEPDGPEAGVRVGGDERLRGRFHGFDWAAARERAAAGTSLRPGDLLAGPPLGVVGGVESGDEVEIDVGGIGTLVQRAS